MNNCDEYKYVFVEFPEPFKPNADGSTDVIRNENGTLRPITGIKRQRAFLATDETVWQLQSRAIDNEVAYRVYRLGKCVAAGDKGDG